MIIAITEINCKNYFRLPAFILLSMKASNQAQHTPGNLFTAIKAKGLKGYTLTAWQDRESLNAFRNFGHHKEAMKRMNRTASSYRSKSWKAETNPGWEEALEALGTVEMKYV